MGANINLNLQTSDNYYVVLKSDKLFNSSDITFYIKNFKVPSMKISPADVDVNQNIIHFPSQGRMDYEELTLEVMVDDNLNSYLELVKWMHRLKDPAKLLQAHTEGYDAHNPDRRKLALKTAINSSNQHPIEYRDLDVYVTDRNNVTVFKFNFVDAWISDVSSLDFDAQDSEYMGFDISLYFLYMRVFDMDNNQIIPPLDVGSNTSY